MTQTVTMEQAYNNLASVIEGIRFLPAEYAKIQNGMQIMAQAMLPGSAADISDPAAAGSKNGKKKTPAAK